MKKRGFDHENLYRFLKYKVLGVDDIRDYIFLKKQILIKFNKNNNKQHIKF